MGEELYSDEIPVGEEESLPEYKVVLLGDSTVGKSSIMRKYADGVFNVEIESTLGADLREKVVTIGDERVKLKIWDTAGQERFNSITRSYYKGMDGIILVYSVIAFDTLQHIERWINSIQKEVTDYKTSCALVMAGNKIDMDSQRCVSEKDGENIAMTYGAKLFEVSAKTGTNIEELFSLIAEMIHEKKKAKPADTSDRDTTQVVKVEKQRAPKTQKKKRRFPC